MTAAAQARAERLDWAVRRLMECRSTAAVVSEMSEKWGISRRQAQRVVGHAHEQLALDLEGAGLERRQLAAQLIHGLMEAMSKALASGHASAVVGCSRELRELVRLSAPAPAPFGRFGRSGTWQ